jgi:hypothetical protein
MNITPEHMKWIQLKNISIILSILIGILITRHFGFMFLLLFYTTISSD